MDQEPRQKRPLSPLQRQRADCLGDQLKGKKFDSKEERKQAFNNAVQFCKRKYPK